MQLEEECPVKEYPLGILLLDPSWKKAGQEETCTIMKPSKGSRQKKTDTVLWKYFIKKRYFLNDGFPYGLDFPN